MASGGSFSLLLEWFTDPVVSGCFALLGIGAIVQVVLWPLVYHFDKRNEGTVCFVLAFIAFAVFVASCVCCGLFSDWAGASA